MSEKLFYFYAGGGHEVKADDGVIRGVAVATAGEVKNQNLNIDESFLSSIVEAGNASKNGIKSRFGHPNRSDDKTGAYLGKLKDFRLDGNVVRADLHLSKTAKKSPRGNLFDYVMEMAANEPDEFGLSVAFNADGFYKMSAGEKIPVDKKTAIESGDCFVELGRLDAVDIVDDPAVNPTGLFTANVDDSHNSEVEKKQKKEKTDMDLLKQMIEKFGSAKAAEYCAAGMTMEQAQMKFSADNAAAELDGLKSQLAEKDGIVASLSEKVKAFEQRISEMGKGSQPVAMSAAPAEQKALTFDAVVSGIMATGKTQFDAIREAAKNHKDLHSEWLASKKIKFNSVV